MPDGLIDTNQNRKDHSEYWTIQNATPDALHTSSTIFKICVLAITEFLWANVTFICVIGLRGLIHQCLDM